ncbi:MAG: flavodoxin [Desulfovibrio sp.]|nr:flavodoxin [Desulfovibrio sp.]
MSSTDNRLLGRRTALKLVGGFAAFSVLFPGACMTTEAKEINGKILVAYFSATGTTARVAKNLAEGLGANLFEIRPEKPYTPQDLDWHDKNSRSSVEMNNPNSRPAIAAKVENMGQFETIFVGFPIWWNRSPTIISTFLESYDFTGKTIVPFATSGGSGLGETARLFKAICPKATVRTGRVLNGNPDKSVLVAWAKSILE